MRKGIYLSALIYIEGDQAPAENFAALSKDALKRALDGCLTGSHNDLTMSLKQISVQNDIEDVENTDGGDEPAAGKEAGKQEEKFEF
jgi:hypothetical protein